MDRRDFLVAGSATLLAPGAYPALAAAPARPPELRVSVDLTRDAGPLPHNWETTVGSDRLAVAFRERWLQELATAHELCGFGSVRCHGLFDDEMGICTRVGTDGPVTSFVYLDQVYDRLLQMGVRPFVELSFMPTALASSRNAVFWYRGNASPPKRMDDWAKLNEAFARHVVGRYGIREVSTWRFECWNEPNLNFWSATQAEYFELYRRTVQALKGVDTRLQVGGPATAQMGWIPQFLDYCKAHQLPVDFVSSHVYADDSQLDVFGQADRYPTEQVIPRALEQARAQMKQAGYGETPLILSEWSSQNPAFIAHTVKTCLGLAETLSFWQVSSVFEEQGPPPSFATSVYGLFMQSSVPRASLHAFTLLHRIGRRQLWCGDGPVLASKRDDGSVAILLWNLATTHQRGTAGNPIAAFEEEVLPAAEPRRLTLQLLNAPAKTARLTLLDPARSSAEAAYVAMGRPEYPSREEIEELRQRAALPAPTPIAMRGTDLSIKLPANAVALLEVPS
jgi:xylan 1,4-beta-xylosidase